MNLRDKIDKIMKAVKKCNKEASYDVMLVSIQSEFGVAMRTAVEYLNVALYNLKLDKNDLTRGLRFSKGHGQDGKVVLGKHKEGLKFK